MFILFIFHDKCSRVLWYVLWSICTYRSFKIVVPHGSESFGPRSILSNEHPSQSTKLCENQGSRVNWPIPTSSYDSNMEPQFSHKIRRFQYCTIYHLILVNFGDKSVWTRPISYFLQLWPRNPKPGLRNRTCPACPACQIEDQKDLRCSIPTWATNETLA